MQRRSPARQFAERDRRDRLLLVALAGTQLAL
jgi:hypothetical protein